MHERDVLPLKPFRMITLDVLPLESVLPSATPVSLEPLNALCVSLLGLFPTLTEVLVSPVTFLTLEDALLRTSPLNVRPDSLLIKELVWFPQSALHSVKFVTLQEDVLSV